ncbi:BlaI/MecI/CopY family transcriptional regulator [Erysipelothrix sp. HDW6C]|uniref:BlaI/MecI/CopY family transcriptional regulator n=1 Tax=Erysipelothrix sp. HDW6C TaxID=2714930 RepID=UPI00140D73C9|nr:BlaI/MecI/CopY family transcriptional regulator [Erysipelothrix sp. HDW6C]QIK68938.1 BlaI/MecI/CopY family transcriptional regulator [Erysipelothrix sp. HDW6C]
MKNISETELEIMNVIWEHNKAVTVKDIQDLLSDNGWKTTTVQTFMNRLSEKGYLRVEKINRSNYYTAAINRSEYSVFETKKIITNVHSGSIRNFVASLVDGDSLTASEISELKAWLNKK